MPDSTRLATKSSTLHMRPNIKVTRGAGGNERTEDGLPIALPGEVVYKVSSIDTDHTLTGIDPNARRCRLAPTSTVGPAAIIKFASPYLGTGIVGPSLPLSVILPLLLQSLVLKTDVFLGSARPDLQTVLPVVIIFAVIVVRAIFLNIILLGLGKSLLGRQGPSVVVHVVVLRREGHFFADIVIVVVVAIQDRYGVSSKPALPRGASSVDEGVDMLVVGWRGEASIRSCRRGGSRCCSCA
mmetsp:Transcript_25070/g.54666  ORF Transcript_25070/g.54666 Transcript_25070/m.54666 type:complete len:240 (+) Transcript_25070:183-902(+)